MKPLQHTRQPQLSLRGCTPMSCDRSPPPSPAGQPNTETTATAAHARPGGFRVMTPPLQRTAAYTAHSLTTGYVAATQRAGTHHKCCLCVSESSIRVPLFNPRETKRFTTYSIGYSQTTLVLIYNYTTSGIVSQTASAHTRDAPLKLHPPHLSAHHLRCTL